MNLEEKLAVTSRAFSENPTLRGEIQKLYREVKFNDSGRVLSRDETISFLKGFSRAIVALEPMDDSVLAALPDLKIVAKYGVGLDNLDLAAFEKRGVKLGWQGGVNRRSVSELTLAFMLICIRRIVESNQMLREGKWSQPPGAQLSGKTVGLIGCGFVGKEMVGMLQPFGCKILAYDIRDYSDFYREHQVKKVSLEQLLQQSDVVSVHIPCNVSSRGMLSAHRLGLMKQGAVLINTARGGITDEGALKAMLKSGRLSAAAFDVFGVEPPQDPELLRLSNFFGTPHIGGSASEAQLAMGYAAIEGLKAAKPVKQGEYPE